MKLILLSCLLLSGCIWTRTDTDQATTAITNWTERTATSMERIATSTEKAQKNWQDNSERLAISMEKIADSTAILADKVGNRIDDSREHEPWWRFSAVAVAAATVVYLILHSITSRQRKK